MEKAKNLKLDPSSPLFDSWNIFLFSYYLMGRYFTDIAYLKWGNIVEDKVTYPRSINDIYAASQESSQDYAGRQEGDEVNRIPAC